MINNSGKLNILVVVGNGFDLNLKLKSSYSDFFDYLIESNTFLEKFKEGSCPEASDFNFDKTSCWPYIFIFNRYEDNSWKDIEQNLYNFFMKNKQNNYLDINVLKKNADDIKNPSHYSYFDIYNKDHVSRFVLRNLKNINGSSSLIRKNEIEEVLFKELNVLEQTFHNYMKEQVKTIDYKKISLELLMKIITMKNEKEINDFEHVDILNFNYTSITKDNENLESINEGKIFFTERNIHGTLSNERENCNIIFGIDSEGLNVDSSGYRYSKTYRVINNNITSYLNSFKSIRNDYNYIYFYGHSLGKQDYSYFQSIFDTVNLYSGKTILRFLYTPYQKDKIKQKIDISFDVAKLIETYGKSFEQEKIKGKNLLHRLILENRLEIVEFDPDLYEFSINDSQHVKYFEKSIKGNESNEQIWSNQFDF